MNSLSFDNRTYAPIIFSGIDAGSQFTEFRTQWEKANGALIIVDDEKEERKEYGLLRDPSLLMSGAEPEHDPALECIWIVIPWRKTAVRTLAKDAYRALRASRNHNLLTKHEASILSKKRIGIAGLNVGNPAAICLAQEGIGSYIRMADNDTLSLSNLNRFRASIADLGVNKAVLSARQAYEIDPFLEIDVWENGVSPESLPEFVANIDILIEEMDAPPLKLAIREEARKQRIPTIMITGNGHDIILDIERFDTDPDLPILSGKLTDDVKRRIAQGPKNFEEKVALAQDFMGEKYLCERLNSSFQEVGKTLIGIPQLAEASFLRGAVLAHACRGIFLSEEIKSGRYAFGLSDLYHKPV